MNFYSALKLAMDERSITPSELSEKTGLHPSYFSKLKSGHMKDPTWDKAITIIKALGMNPEEFLALQESDVK